MNISKNWRLQKQRYGLVGEVCPHCDAKIFPPRDVCPNCVGEAKLPFAFSGKGEVYSYTVVYDAPEGFEHRGPYVVAIVKLEEGPMVTAILTDLETKDIIRKTPISQESGWPKEIVEVPGKEFVVNIGMQVEMVTRHLTDEPGSDGDRNKGMKVYGFEFRPVLEINREREV